MSSDTILRDDEGQRWSLGNLSTHSFLLGQIGGALRVAAWLAAKAVEAFKQGDDKAAVDMRNLSKTVLSEIVPELQKAAQTYETDHPSQFEEDS